MAVFCYNRRSFRSKAGCSDMIVRPTHHWFLRLFVWHGSVLSKILFRLALNGVMSVVAVYFLDQYPRWGIRLTLAPFSLLGVAIAIALGFRNNASYARFVEARLLWGRLLITQRSLLRQLKSAKGATRQEIDRFTALQIAFCCALKHLLRHTDPAADLRRLLPAGQVGQILHGPSCCNRLLLRMGDLLGQVRQQGRLSDIVYAALDENLNRLSDILGGCERIDNTPIPFAYALILHRSVYLFCTLLPFGLAGELHYMTIPVSMFISYTMVALDSLAEELETPFGTEPNHLPLTTLCTTIEINLMDMNDAGQLPARPQPDRHYQLR